MEKLSLELLRKLGACAEAKEVYERRPVSEPKEAIELLISGCDELSDISERERNITA